MDFSRRVLVTRAPHQGSQLAERLRALGLEPVMVPAIEIVPPRDPSVFEEAVAHLASFDWVVFTSTNAVEAFRRRCGEHGTGTAKIAAIGSATARALATAGAPADLVPPQAVAESLTEALLPYVRRPDGSAAHFLLIRAEEGREHLPETLRAAGADVSVVAAYRNVVPESSVRLLHDLLGTGELALGAVTFTSSSTARNFYALCEAARVVLPASVRRVSMGPITSETLRELGWRPDAEAPEATIEALAETVAQVLNGSGN